MEFDSIWTIFVRPNPTQTLNSLPIRLREIYNDDNFSQLLPLWSEYDPTEKQQSEMWTNAGGALQLGSLEVYLAIEDASEAIDYINYAPVYDIECVQARILKIPTHYINFGGIIDWLNRFNGAYDILFDPVDPEDLPF